MKPEPGKCAICGGDVTGFGNNPEPFPGEKCCDDCNDRFVVPTRMCLGRGYSNESVLMLLTTVAELGKMFVSMNAEIKARPELKVVGGRSLSDLTDDDFKAR